MIVEDMEQSLNWYTNNLGLWKLLE
jgi:hypothetical protein